MVTLGWRRLPRLTCTPPRSEMGVRGSLPPPIDSARPAVRGTGPARRKEGIARRPTSALGNGSSQKCPPLLGGGRWSRWKPRRAAATVGLWKAGSGVLPSLHLPLGSVCALLSRSLASPSCSRATELLGVGRQVGSLEIHQQVPDRPPSGFEAKPTTPNRAFFPSRGHIDPKVGDLLLSRHALARALRASTVSFLPHALKLQGLQWASYAESICSGSPQYGGAFPGEGPNPVPDRLPVRGAEVEFYLRVKLAS